MEQHLKYLEEVKPKKGEEHEEECPISPQIVCRESKYKLDIEPENFQRFLTHWCSEAEEMFYKAKLEGDAHYKIQALKEIRSLAKLNLEAHAIIKDIATSFKWEDIMPYILNAVQAFPEARTELSKVFRRKKIGVDVK
jgi:hypothetical protein